MNWEAIGAIGEIGGAIAVLVTLIYLALQIRQSNRASLLSSFQHTYDSLNGFCDLIAESEELASIIHRGRASFSNLSEEEQLRFECAYNRLLNTVESWHFQATETSRPGPYREEQLRNVAEVVRKYFDHPGVLQYWDTVYAIFSPEVRELIQANTQRPSSSERERTE